MPFLCRCVRRLLPLVAVCAVCGCDGGQGGSGIVSLAPNLTETIYALGEGRQLIGRSEFDDYPPEVRALPALGGYIDPDLERIAMRSPAMIFVPGRHEQVTRFAEMQGITVVNVHMDSFETIFGGIETIGAALGREREATALRARIESDLEAIRQAVSPFERRSVLIVLGRERGDLSNLQTVGSASFISEIVAVAGGDNIYGDAPQAYLEASKETVVMKAPDAILEIQAGKTLTRNQQQALYNDWRFLDTVPAVRNGSIYYVTDSHAMRPGPRIAEVARIVARRLHFKAELPE